MIDPLDYTIFYQEGVYGKNSKETTVKATLTDIVRGKYKTQIDYLRDLVSKEEHESYDKNKKSLPAVTFSANFHKERTTADVKSYTNLLVLDIDDLVNEDNVVICENMLRADKYVISYWRSPSNLGLKGLVYLDYKEYFPLEQSHFFHEKAFIEVEKYFDTKYGIKLDKSGKDITRLCFISLDTKLFYNKHFEKFQVSLIPAAIKEKSKKRRLITFVDSNVNADALYNPENKNNQWHRKEMRQIIKFLKKRDLSITCIHKDWSSVARTIACCFTFDIGLKYFQALSMQDVNVYDAGDCERFLKERYLDTRTEFSFATILYLANEKGYNSRGVDRNRRKIMDVIRFLVREKLSLISSGSVRKEIGKSLVQTFEYELGIKYFKLLNKQNAVSYDELECENYLKELYLNEYEEYTIEVILKLAKRNGYKRRGEVLKTTTEPIGEEGVSINSFFSSENV